MAYIGKITGSIDEIQNGHENDDIQRRCALANEIIPEQASKFHLSG